VTDAHSKHVIACPECRAGSGDIWAVSPPGWEDGALYWRCMACGYAWHRFTMGTPEWEYAETKLKEAQGGTGDSDVV